VKTHHCVEKSLIAYIVGSVQIAIHAAVVFTVSVLIIISTSKGQLYINIHELGSKLRLAACKKLDHTNNVASSINHSINLFVFIFVFILL